MNMPGSFLGGAKDRLLPASIPFRFFLAASGFHILAWITLFAGADELADFRGGTGMVLAAVHLLTLGVLALSAMGASYQLLPVVTRQPLLRTWPARLSFWLMLPGILVLTAGMSMSDQAAMIAGAGLASAGLLTFTILTADNLARAGSIACVAAHGWGALAALSAVTGLGMLLSAGISPDFLPDFSDMAVTHMVLAIFGFMGLLVIGLSQVLIPMFVLSRSLPPRLGWVQLGLAIVALGLFTSGMLTQRPILVLAAFGPAFGACLVYFLLMRGAFKSSMRKRLGLSFVLIRLSWVFFGLGLAIGLGIQMGVPIANGPVLFGFVTLVGWLLTFLIGILQRIMPFLASMHAANRLGRPPLLSELSAELPLQIHAVCHFLALALCSLGIVLDLKIFIQIGAVAGVTGAVAFTAFAINVLIQLKRPPKNV